MGRSKVKLAWIQNNATRRRTYKKRAQGLLKKVSELGVLCDVDTFAVLYNPYDHNPDIWPNQEDDVQRILARLGRCSELERNRNMFNQEDYLRQKISKIDDQRRKIATQMHDLEMTGLLFECIRGKELTDIIDESAIRDLIRLVESKLCLGTHRLQQLRDQQPTPPAN